MAKTNNNKGNNMELKNSSTCAVLYNSGEGLCVIREIELDASGTPAALYEPKHRGTTQIMGWGSLDGLADIWDEGGAAEWLVPRGRR